MPYRELMCDVRTKEKKKEWGDFFQNNRMLWSSGRPFSKEDFHLKIANWVFINRDLYLTYGVSCSILEEIVSFYSKIDSPRQLLRKIKEHFTKNCT